MNFYARALSNSFLVEKRKTGEYLAAKVVRSTLLIVLGKSRAHAETHYAVLGKQADPQTQRKDLRSVSALCGGRKVRGRQDVPRNGHGPTRQVARGFVPGMPPKVRLEDGAAHCDLDDTAHSKSARRKNHPQRHQA